MKARSTIWYSNFFMTQHDDQRWVEPFQMTRVILQIMERLQPLIEKDTSNTNLLFLLAFELLVHFSNLHMC
jgi:hypothetical protein